MHNRTESKQVVNEKVSKQLKNGYPLLEKDWFSTEDLQEGTLLTIEDQSNRFIAKAYVGKQNVGNGWVLSTDQQEPIDLAFFKGKLTKAIEKRQAYFRSEDTTAFRLFNSEGDGIGGLQIDYYAGYIVITWY